MKKPSTEDASTETKGVDKNKSAVALKYDRGVDPAPKLVAKGKGVIAEQIITVALENDIEIREDADLVEIIEKMDIDSVIPLEAYSAVAEILSYVYRANAKAKDHIKRKETSA